jgi:uncharacterized phage protein (TIGR02218 family)
MRAIPPALQARLDDGVTTLAHCWKLTRSDGVVLGFTDHDSDLVLDGVTYRASTGFTASEATSRFDLAIDGAEVAGALDDEALNEHDLAGGRFDGAGIETWLVDWSDPALRVQMSCGTIGEVRRDDRAFTAEIRGIGDRLAQDSGRLYAVRCDADLGDGRCKINLADPAHHGAGSVAQTLGVAQFRAAGLDGFAPDVLSGGRLTWTGGGKAGLVMDIKMHGVRDGAVHLTLWQAMAEPITEGDAFTVTAGCDKTFATCRDRFANGVNFRGFPAIPGNDYVIRYPNAGEPGNTGASRGVQG